MSVHMIGTILSVVLDHENSRVLPELALADGLDNTAQGEIIISHLSARCRRTDLGSRGVIVRQTHDNQARKTAVALEPLQLLDEAIGTLLIEIIQIPSAIHRIEMTFERLDARLGRIADFLAFLHPFTVTAITDAGLDAAIPQVAAGRTRNRIEVALGRIEAEILDRAADGSAAIGLRPNLLDEIRGVGTHRPLMTVRGYLTLDVEIIQQHELASELVMVGCHLFIE